MGFFEAIGFWLAKQVAELIVVLVILGLLWWAVSSR